METNKISVRKYQPGDAEALANIYYYTIHTINIKHYTQEQVDVWAPKTSLETTRWAKKFERTQPFVAIINDSIIGFAEFENDGHIDCFYCHHLWIGQGVGSTLMKAILDTAKDRGISRIFSEVSITAKPFFERHGFTTVTEQTIVKNEITMINYKMERLL